MKYTLRIIFDGLVAIGPAYPRQDELPHKTGPLFAVMPFATRKRSRKSELQPASHPVNPLNPAYTSVHFPVILTDIPFREDYRHPDEIYTPVQTPLKPLNLWYPMRERMELFFNREGKPGLLTFEQQDRTYRCPEGPPRDYVCEKIEPDPTTFAPDGSSRKPLSAHIAAVSDMREIWPRRAKIRRKMLRRRTPAPHEVAAQVFVPWGNVTGGTDDHQYPYGVCVRYEPKQTKDTVKKCAVQQVIITVDDVSEVDFVMHSLDTGRKLDPISFELKDHSDIRIINADPTAIRTLLTGRTIPAEDYRGADVDFENFYGLLAGRSGRHLPIPHVDDPKFMLRPCYTTLVDGDD